MSPMGCAARRQRSRDASILPAYSAPIGIFAPRVRHFGCVVILRHEDHCPTHIARVRRGAERHRDHAALKAALDAWFDEVQKAPWSSAADVKRSYATGASSREN
jgi:hypothetical protein